VNKKTYNTKIVHVKIPFFVIFVVSVTDLLTDISFCSSTC
jgi:hypothetical protein